MERDGLRLKFGPLEINVDGLCFGKARYNGEPLPLQGFTVEAAVGEDTRITLRTSAASLDDSDPEDLPSPAKAGNS